MTRSASAEKIRIGVSPPSSDVPTLSPSLRAKRRRGAAQAGHLNPTWRSSNLPPKARSL
eukprot:CAMPEP_0172853394 /NCGR_PEP_ID=MMETSP1075-20121228/57007_1 /TAXON_ID=2916 /ORGANISM="Ceratium fusus, Strain PA161109" /LENGTH=58 /DNA_ID=CAMNT_0013699879 /DNA_START=9 /DNA_END=185 /DNA_ORIENTATION=-